MPSRLAARASSRAFSRSGASRGAWLAFAVVASAALFERFVGEASALGVLEQCVPRGAYVLLAACAVGTAAVARAWRALGLSVATLAVAIGPLGGLELAAGAGERAEGGRAAALRVVQYNVDKWDSGAAAIGETVLSLAPDVVCLEEAGRYRWLPGDDQRPEALARALPGYAFASEGEIAVASKLPIVLRRAVPLAPGPSSRPMLEAIVRAGPARRTEISVLAVHLIPTLPLEPWAEDRGEAASAGLVAIAAARAAQVAAIRAYVAKLPRPAVVCGDFNAIPTSRTIRSLEGSLDDAFRARGAGFGYTAPATFPQQRVDYVFVRGVSVVGVEVSSAMTSDHRPLVVELAVD
jgi:endonuclease/exonuclease/phosphatase (EEP) superfamily protein YafD